MTTYSNTTKTNPIAQAFHSAGNMVRGENGENKLRDSGSSFVDAFTKMVRGTSRDHINKMVEDMFRESSFVGGESSLMEASMIKDIFTLAFHKRQMRGDGEGEKKLFYYYILTIYKYYPETVISLVKNGLFEHYGYFKDYFLIWNIICEEDSKTMTQTALYNYYDPLIRAFRDHIISVRRSDLSSLVKFIKASGKNISDMNVPELNRFVCEVRDSESAHQPDISLLAKFIPKEGRALAKNCFWFIAEPSHCPPHMNLKKQPIVKYLIRGALKMRNKQTGEMREFPYSKDIPFGAMKSYRKENSLLGAFLDVTEQKMCGNRFSEIDHSRTASLCMSRNSKGFLNEKRKVAPQYNEEETGNRHPNLRDRVECRKNLRAHFTNPDNLNTKMNLPHMIAFAAHNAKSTADKDMQKAIWNKMVADTREKLQVAREQFAEEARQASKASGVDMSESVQRALGSGNFVGVADMSGSMTWDGKAPNRPYDVAIGLTAFMSEVANNAWRDVAMSFSENPSIFSFRKHGRSMDIMERMHTISQHEGYTTNYYGLHQEVIRVMKAGGLTDSQMPVLVIFTDGEFNQQISDDTAFTKTGHEKIEQLYARNGFKSMATIVYWNLKPGRNGVQTSKDHLGVQFLQGQAPGLFKYVLYGETADITVKEVEVDGKSVEMKTSSITPYDTFRKAIDNDYYNRLLHVLSNSNENALSFFRFTETIED